MSTEALPLKRLAEQFATLPGIGRKTAWRLAFFVLTLSEEQAEEFANAVLDAHRSIHRCSVCQNFTEKEICDICGDSQRDASVLCVVESPKDVVVFERSRGFNGLYHVLHGLISPMDGIGPDQLTVKELLQRIRQGEIKEVIMATNPTVEGEATAMYLSKILKPLDIEVSRLAYGVPVGGELEYVDEMTISKAIENRNPL